MSASPNKIRIDIVSDVVCPWCIIGYKQLQKALDALPGQFETAGSVMGALLSNDRFGRPDDYVSSLKGKYESLQLESIQGAAEEVLVVDRGKRVHRIVRGEREQTAHAAVAVNGIDDKPFSAVLGVSQLKVMPDFAEIIGPEGEPLCRIEPGDIVSIHGQTGEVFTGSREIYAQACS